jgi:hypothetical protein
MLQLEMAEQKFTILCQNLGDPRALKLLNMYVALIEWVRCLLYKKGDTCKHFHNSIKEH